MMGLSEGVLIHAPFQPI